MMEVEVGLRRGEGPRTAGLTGRWCTCAALPSSMPACRSGVGCGRRGGMHVIAGGMLGRGSTCTSPPAHPHLVLGDVGGGDDRGEGLNQGADAALAQLGDRGAGLYSNGHRGGL